MIIIPIFKDTGNSNGCRRKVFGTMTNELNLKTCNYCDWASLSTSGLHVAERVCVCVDASYFI